MPDLTQIPFWAAPALSGAILAAVGYLGKLIADFVLEWRKEARLRRARLSELLSLLRAGRVAFLAQCAVRNRLYDHIKAREPGANAEVLGYDRFFFEAHATMRPEELKLHEIIRAYTVFTIKPLNDRLLEWLQKDDFFRGTSPGDATYGRLAVDLSRLEQHLLLWRAKFETWIPDQPKRCVVYLNDVEGHGLPFPHELEGLVADALGHRTCAAAEPADPVPSGAFRSAAQADHARVQVLHRA
jgi:hypothetical protein